MATRAHSFRAASLFRVLNRRFSKSSSQSIIIDRRSWLQCEPATQFWFHAPVRSSSGIVDPGGRNSQESCCWSHSPRQELTRLPSQTREFSSKIQASPWNPRDRIVLRGLLFHGFHGVLEAERQLGQKFLVDVDAVLDLLAAGESDDLRDTVSYAEVYMSVKEIVEGPPFQLVEAVAAGIAKKLLHKFKQFHSVRVRVGKPHVAVPGAVEFLGVDIVRKRSESSSKHPRKHKEPGKAQDQWDELASD